MGSLQEGDKQEKHTKAHNDTTDPQNLKLLRRITRTENILHRNFTRRQVAIQNRVASNIGISQSTFSVKVLNLLVAVGGKRTSARVNIVPCSGTKKRGTECL